MEPLGKEYMPLDGEELLEIIKRKIGPLLSEYNQYFGKHLAYHNPWIRLAVKVECFTPEKTPTDGGFELSTQISGPIWEPDRIREEVGLGTYETQLVDEYSGALADVKVGEKTVSDKVLEMGNAILNLKDRAATLEKVNKLLGKQDEEKKRSSKRKKRHGWPKGKPRGKKLTNALPTPSVGTLSEPEVIDAQV